MRLSRAILVMLLLHVVAVGGILAFSLIKERGHSRNSASPAGNALEAEDSDAPPARVEHNDADTGGTLANARQAHPGDALTRVSNDPSASPAEPSGANDAVARIAAGHANAGNSPAASGSTPAEKSVHLPLDSGKTYTVQKGESPYTIAEKWKVDASALLKLNGIDDPKKLKPGQTLHIPAPNHAKAK